MSTIQSPAVGRGPLQRPGRTVAALLAVALMATACTDDPETPDAGSSNPGGPLAGVCPDPIVAQTGWWPQAEHAALYNLVGEGYTIDATGMRVTGPLVAGGEDTGVQIEVRAGGPAIGFQMPHAAMYADDDITMSVVSTDLAVAGSSTTPVLGVMAVLDIFPAMIMWDPETYPEFNTVVDIGQSDVTVLYFQDAPYMEYLIGSGILRREQVDGSYDGQPARWVTEDGTIAQQGFATSEPYTYENELEQWNKPVKLQLIHHLGYQVYDMLSIRTDQRDELAPCLERLVPIVQQSVVDYIAAAEATNALIVEVADAYQGHPYSLDKAAFSRQQMLDLEIIGNAGNATIGDFDIERVDEVIGIVSPIYSAQRVELVADLGSADIVTNEFIDEAIGLP